VDSAIAALNRSTSPPSGPTQYARVKDSNIAAHVPMHAELFDSNLWAQQNAGSAIASPAGQLAVTKLSDIRASVSNLAQAIGSFDSLSTAVRDHGLAQATTSVTPAPSNTTLTVASMVDVMKRFDSNGNALFASGSGAVALGKSITMPGLQDPAKNAMLASPAG
jgi:hypothetical protein